MSIRIGIITVVLLALAAPMQAGQGPSGLCPPGFDEMFNVNEPGCTFCSAPTECNVECLGPPACFCPPDDAACCAANPCCFNCPNADSLECNVSSCICEPDTCCFTVCPPTAPAPTNSTAGLAFVAAILVALGAGTLQARARRP